MQQTCGNCGKPVGGSDITCPHCDALLAAYASPIGSITTTSWEASAPVAEAVPPVTMDEPAPAAKVEIPAAVETGSSAPRPLFDTNVTIEELREAAEDDHDETLVVVPEEDAASKPMVFDGPDYARPPSDAKPVPVVEDADEKIIARPTEPAKAPSEPETINENALAGPSEEVAPARPVRKQRPTPEERRERAERGQTEEYLKRLHAQAGYDSSQAALSRPVDAQAPRTSRQARPMAVRRGADQQAAASLEKSRKGCSALLMFVLFFLWLGVVGGILTGDMNPGLLFVAVALSFLARFLGKPLTLAGKQ